MYSIHGKHAKTGSETTSISLSSPPRSPPQPAYYVQSPIEYGERSAPSYHSTPARSPPPRYEAGHRSWEPPTGAPTRMARHRDDMAWRDREEIEEESLLRNYGTEDDKKIPRRFYVLGFVVLFLLLFFLFALILWGASHNQNPEVTMNSITIESFNVQAGTDSSLVPTDLLTMNSTLKMTYRNTGNFFGVHVTATPVLLNFYQLTIARGNMDYFYQPRKSERKVEVVVMSDEQPLYGGESGLSSKQSSAPVNLTLSFTMRSRAFVLGKLVKPKFYNRVQCAVVMDQTKLKTPVSLKKSCQFS
ncbi:hypothetical protein Cni_G19935 [Canna indica]|uniref:Late embryogenesis abundant protein LEA-2 subgroup domain-containing protein n=1 Tax=Canna indica TaxID=4628 RepID=A0AAQ3QJ29_9LILI|nr:hypothetical protein Cni_G19935 [Canna indica]